jgi:transposase
MFVDVISYSEAARRLDVSHKTISDMARKKKLRIREHPSNGLAKGLDMEGFRVLEDALRPISANAR